MKDDQARIISKAIVQRMKKLRLEMGLSHNELANKAGITRAAISHIENGKRNPSLIMTLKLAHALGIQLSELLESIEENPRRPLDGKTPLPDPTKRD